MDTTVNVTPSLVDGVTELDAARGKLVEAATKTGAVIADYAKAITNVFGKEWWLLKGKDKKGLKAERDKFSEIMVARGIQKQSVDNYWKRVKEAAGYVTTNNRVNGEGGIDQKNLDDLRTIINRIFKSEEDGSDSPWSEEKAVLMDVYDRMGGEVDKLG